MNRTIVRKKPQRRVKDRERKPKVTRPPARKAPSPMARQNHNGDEGNGRRNARAKPSNGKVVTTAATPASKALAIKEGATFAPPVEATKLGPASKESQSVTVQPQTGPLATDLLARMRRAAAAVPDAKIAEVDEAIGVLRRIVSRALGRGRGIDERERKAVLSMLCDEVKTVLLRYELVLEGLLFLERLRVAKTRGAVVSARLNLKGLIASLAAEGAPADAVQDLMRRVR